MTSITYPELERHHTVDAGLACEADQGYCLASIPACRRAPLWIATVDGERRPVSVWPDGGWACPFCGGANVPGDRYYAARPWPYPCGNPACIAGGNGSAERVAEIRAGWAAAAARKREADSWRDFEARQRERTELAREAALAEAKAEQAEAGWCWDCWWFSTSGGRWLSRPRKVRHRDPGNCPIARKYMGRRA